jgi:hypothetical protein
MKVARTSQAWSVVRSSEPFRRVTLTRVVGSEIRPSRSSPGMYELPFETSTLPEAGWARAFRQVCDEASDGRRRAIHLTGLRITVPLQVGDDQQRIADDLKELVEETNIRCWTARQREEEGEAGRVEEVRALDARLHRLQAEAQAIEL